MLIRVLRFQGRAPDTITEAEFTEAGGTIGRSAECTLTLPDPERHISRVQAEVAWSGGEFLLVGRMTANPMERNGEIVAAGQAVTLRDGDELQVGDYVLRVEFRQTASTVRNERFDGMTVTAPAASEFGHTFGVYSHKGRATNAGNAEFAPTKPAPLQSEQPGMRTAPGLELTQLNTSMNASVAEAAQRAVTPSFRNDSGKAQPLPNLLDDNAISTTAFRSWDSPDGSGPTLIVGKSQPRSPQPQALAADTEPAAQVTPPEQIAGLVRRAAGAHQREFVAVPKTRPTGFLQELNRKVLDAKVAAGARVANAPPELLHALLSGAGVPDLPGSELDEEMMYRIGTLLRNFSQGLIDLLASRATVKAEMRAEMTIISSEGNNPLKFSPDAATALGYLLGTRSTRGFMPPDDAVRDAIADLLAHQAGMMAAARVALQHLLQRFSPDDLAHRLAGRSMLDSMLPMNRKAKLWELFENIFADISREAQDDFDTLFGREFVKAYEEQIKRLEAGANQSGR